ncbi:alpha-(1,3)-fucosyltransferase C-like isoform X2 [Oratosquilla oratoria]|uniref:alpha-(1,3)-fucosyltransferase C-like isoform X2 n=1 Tax=Oratosquilla oratoria TaxID=337810 RepID=UPI003F76DC54
MVESVRKEALISCPPKPSPLPYYAIWEWCDVDIMATKRYCHRIIKKKFIFPLLVTFSLLYIWWGVKTRSLVGGLQGRIFSIQALSKIPAENQIRETSGQKQGSLHNHGAVNTTGSTGRPINSVEQHPAKKILFWTSFSGGPKEKRIGMFNRNNKCVVDKCEITIDPEEVTSADAVLFHLSYYTATKLPTYRRPSQLYVAFSREAPALVRGKQIGDYPDVFNVTMTYRRDSDVVVPYGVITPRTTPVDVNDYWQKKNKSLLVSWLVSNCKTSSRREAYVEILKRHIPVDVYGKCGNNQCGPRLGNQPHGCDFVYNDYMFYLAFENQICRDYVTEKFFKPLLSSAVPVVMGGADYNHVGPPNSYIDALAFPGPKELAQFLTTVAANRTLYNSYHQWRRNYKVDFSRVYIARFCDLCALLHNRTDVLIFKPDPLATPKGILGRVNGTYPDMANWFLQGSQCRSWTPGPGVND